MSRIDSIMKSLSLLIFSSGIALAHHGQDFFVTLDARVPAKDSFSLFSTAAAGEEDLTVETGLLAGLGAGFAAGFAVDFTDSGGFHAAGITPMLQWSMPIGESPLRLGANLSYHFFDGSRDSSGGTGGHSHGGHSHKSTTRSKKSGFNPDAPPPPTPPTATLLDSGGSSTIHLHDEDYLLSRLILEYEFSHHTRLVGNLIFSGTSTSDIAIGYALAVRHEFTPKWALGFEAIGDFNPGGYHQLVAGIIHSPRHDLGLRLGLSHGLGATDEGASALCGLTWRF